VIIKYAGLLKRPGFDAHMKNVDVGKIRSIDRHGLLEPMLMIETQ